MMGFKKKQHFVPEVYLKQFENCKGELYTLDIQLIRGNKKVYVSKPKTAGKVGYGEHIYTVDARSRFTFGEKYKATLDPMFIEDTLFKMYENDLGYLIQKMVLFNKLNFHEARKFAQIIIDLKLRNMFTRDWLKPEMTGVIETTKKEVFKKYSKLFNQEVTSKNELKKVKKLINLASNNFKNQEDLVKRLHNESLASRALSGNEFRNREADTLLAYQWRLFSTKSPNHFISSDNPGYTFDLETNNIQNIKLKEKFVLFLPLSPNFNLVISDSLYDTEYFRDKKIKILEVVVVDGETVDHLNSFATQKAFKYLIADNKESLQRFEN